MPIDPDLLALGATYSRADLAEIFNEPNIASSREGLYARDQYAHVPFFVTLDKANADPSVAYNDYFDDGLFFWESQNSNTLRSKWIQHFAAQAVTPLLFVRRVAKVRGVTQPFVYAGRLGNMVPDPNSSRPVKFVSEPIDIGEVPPESLEPLLQWSPGADRSERPTGEYARQVSAKRAEVRARSQGFETDPLVRRAIELRAMQVATATYEQHGYSVEDVSAVMPYDLVCTKTSVKARRVEVKGTRGAADAVILTKGEVAAARDPGTVTDLLIVHGIELNPNGGSGGPSANGGKVRLIQSWQPDDRDLEPIQFRYSVPEIVGRQG